MVGRSLSLALLYRSCKENGMASPILDTAKDRARVPTSEPLYGIWGYPDHILAVSKKGAIAHWYPNPLKKKFVYKKAVIKGMPGLNGIWGCAKDLIFAVGRGVVLRSRDGGETWEQCPFTSGGWLYRVWFLPSAKTIWAVGSKGLLFSSSDQGDTWASQQLPTGEDLLAIFGVSESELFVAGFKGVMFASTDGGKTWEKRESGTSQNINCIFGDEHTLYSATNDGYLLRSLDRGKTWTAEQLAPGANLEGGSSKGTLSLVVGSKGTIFIQRPGQPWKALSASPTFGFWDVWIGENTAFISGERGGIFQLRLSDDFLFLP